MSNNASQKVKGRLTAAQRVQAAMAAKMEALTSGVDAAMRAHAALEEAQAAVERADDQLRAAVGDLAAAGQSLEDIASLTEIPLSLVRAARRPKSRDDGDDGTPAVPAPTPVGRARSRPSVPAATRVPHPVGDQVDQHSGGEPTGDTSAGADGAEMRAAG